MNGLFCDIEVPKLLLYSSQVPQLLYYSHVSTALIALILGLYVYLGNKKLLLNQTVFFIFSVYFIWSIFDLIVWAHNDTRFVMFFWSMLILIEPLFFIGSGFLVYTFIKGEDIPFRWKILVGAFLLPVIILLPTSYNLAEINNSSCEGPEGFLAVQYIYSLEVVTVLWILFFSIKSIIKEKNSEKKRLVMLFSSGLALFLLSFSWGNLVSSVTLDWNLSQYGLFGVPIFAGLLTFLIVKYDMFNTKLIGAQALVVGLIILIGSELFFVQSNVNTILVVLTLMIAIIFGWWLVRSVKDEIRQKEEMVDLTEQLATANQKLRKLDQAKTEFLSIASHQLRAPLTAIRGFASLLLEGEYGEMSKEVGGVVKKIEISNDRLAQLTENLLNISRIESGRLSFDFMENNIEESVKTVIGEMEPNAQKKGLYVKYEGPTTPISPFVFDKNKMHEVFMNLLDNAIKYTQKGGITIKVEDLDPLVRITFTDTGMGIPEDDLPSIATKFHRGANACKAHTDGTGIGVYVVSQILKNHNAGLTIASDGEGKGSTFIIEMDKNFQPKSENGGAA